LLVNPGDHDPDFLYDLMANRVPAGVDAAARIKAAFLASLAKRQTDSPIIPPERAVYLPGTIAPLLFTFSDFFYTVKKS